jgi:glucan biosynthesis protein C
VVPAGAGGAHHGEPVDFQPPAHLSSKADAFFATVTLGKLSVLFLLLGIAYAAVRRILFIVYPPILSDGLFNFVVMQSLFYIPFFLIGALAFIYPKLKALFTTPSPWCAWVRPSRSRPIC